MPSPKAAVAGLRAKAPLVDHLVRAVGRYQADAGDRLAAAVTFYWFLSLFPVLLVAIYVFRLLNGDSATADVQRGLSGYLPTQLVQTIGTTIGENAGKAGIIGLLGLLLSGLGWIDALREAIRSMWHHQVLGGNLVLRRVVDVFVLVGLFATVGLSVFVTGLAGSGPRFLLEQLGVDQASGSAQLFLQVIGLLLAGLADTALFIYLFVRLARVPARVREVLQGAVFGAVGFGVLKLVGGYYVQRTTTRGEATYGTFAVVVGLLLFLNLVSRLVLLSAAFVVTAPYDSDTLPSGTAGRAHRRVGRRFPHRAAGGGSIAGDSSKELAVEKSWSARERLKALPELVGRAPEQLAVRLDHSELPLEQGELPPERPASAVPLKGAAQVQLAGRVTLAAGGLVLGALVVYVLKTVRRLLRH